jgi:hypothetical protein
LLLSLPPRSPLSAALAIVEAHSISVPGVTLPLTVEPSLSVIVNVPAVNDAIVPARSAVGVGDVEPAPVLGVVALGACAWNAIKRA